MTNLEFSGNLTNSTNHNTPDKIVRDTPTILRATYGIVGTLSILCNSLLCTVVLRRTRMIRSSHNMLVLTLAITDTVTGLLLISSPTFVVGNYAIPIPSGAEGELFCRFIQRNFFVWALANFSVAIVMSMAIERWYAIARPLKYQTLFTRGNTLKYVFALFVFSITVNTPQLFETHLVTTGLENLCAGNLLGGSRTASWSYAVIYCMVAAFIPFIVITVTYLHLRCAVTYHRQLSQTQAQLRRRHQEMALLRMTAVISLCLGVTFIPDKMAYFLLWFDLVDWDTLNGTAVLCMLNSVVNPWIYCFTNKAYRKEFARILFPCKRLPSVSDTSQDNSALALPPVSHSRLSQDNPYVVSRAD